MTQLCLSQCMTSQWCNHSDHCCNHSDHLITIGHRQWPIVSSSFVNPLDTNCKINYQLSNEAMTHISSHKWIYFLHFKIACVIKAGTLGSPVVHLVTPLECVSLSMNTQPSVPAIETIGIFTRWKKAHPWTLLSGTLQQYGLYATASCFHCHEGLLPIFLINCTLYLLPEQMKMVYWCYISCCFVHWMEIT